MTRLTARATSRVSRRAASRARNRVNLSLVSARRSIHLVPRRRGTHPTACSPARTDHPLSGCLWDEAQSRSLVFTGGCVDSSCYPLRDFG